MARTAYLGHVHVLTVDEVLAIRRRLAKKELGRLDFGRAEPIYADRLQSAVGRQETGFDGRRKYERPHEVAATLFYGVACNHAFENGNKRTALVSYLVSLDRNSYDLVNTTQDDLYEMATQVVARSFPIPSRLRNNPDAEVLTLASWTKSRTTRRSKGDRQLDFPKLRKMLDAYGCEISSPVGNYVTITRDSASVKTGYPRENFVVPVGEIKRIRSQLGLSEVDGGNFYDIDLAVDGFVAEHRQVLDQLADA